MVLIVPLCVNATESKEDILVPQTETVSVTNNLNEPIIYEFLKTELEFNLAVCCGILANIYRTSGFNPEAYSESVIEEYENFGMCQWSGSEAAGNRYKQLQDWCLDNGYDYKTIEGQLYFMKYELETSPYYQLGYLKEHIENTAEGAYEASQLWSKYYQGCNKDDYEERAILARDTYWVVYQDSSDATEPSNPNTGVLGDVNGDGEVKLNDALLLRRYVAGYEVSVDLQVSDMNGDGEVKLDDALLLRRYVAGYDLASE